MKVFVSHAPEDRQRVIILEMYLNRAGFGVMYDHIIIEGRHGESALSEQITFCDAFVYVVSHNALKSDECKFNFYIARKTRVPIVAVVVENEIVSEVHSDLQDYVVGASNGWNINNLGPLFDWLNKLRQ